MKARHILLGLVVGFGFGFLATWVADSVNLEERIAYPGEPSFARSGPIILLTTQVWQGNEMIYGRKVPVISIEECKLQAIAFRLDHGRGDGHDDQRLVSTCKVGGSSG